MATTSDKPSGGTSTRKASSKPATTSTSKTEDTSTATADTSSADTAASEPTANDPAAALKARVRTTQHVQDAKPDELTDEQRLNLVGAPAGSLPGPRTLTTPTAPVRKGEEYVTAETDGYVATVPKYTKQPATVRVWVQGQRVRKDMHDALSGVAATTADAAPVLEGDAYQQVANYL